MTTHLAGTRRVQLTAVQRKALWQVIGQRDHNARICYITSGPDKGRVEPDPALRDIENVPFGWGGYPKTHEAAKETIDAYFEAEVRPHVPGAWVDQSRTKTGYEIPFARHFYEYVPPRPLEEIDKDLNRVAQEILEMLRPSGPARIRVPGRDARKRSGPAVGGRLPSARRPSK